MPVQELRIRGSTHPAAGWRVDCSLHLVRMLGARSSRTSLLVTLLIGTGASATEAWVSAPLANVRLRPSANSPIVGHLEKGDRVELAEDSISPQGWTLLRPLGAVRSSLLVLDPPNGDTRPFDYIYGRIVVPSASVRRAPDPDARIVSLQRRGHVLAFRDTAGTTGAWLERPDGTFVSRAEVKILTGSSFRGVADPPSELAFVLRRTRVRSPDDPNGAEEVLDRYTALEMLSAGRVVRTPKGELPRSAVRIARAVPRPAGIGAEERWIHVNTAEQVLTAYEGDRLVFATLVSTGKSGWETPVGQFRVWYKLRHGEMRGHRASYLVEEVPHALFFGADTALHGANWHDRFGIPVSHGCINLSPQDAAWLFRWAPPELPEAWHGILPGAAGLETLWIIVESGALERASADRGASGFGPERGRMSGMPERFSRRSFLGGAATLAGTLAVWPRSILASPAESGERVLSFVHTHTGERLSLPYWGDGAYLPQSLARVESFLRDFRTGEFHAIDPLLLDQLYDLRLATGSSAPFQVISGYRSPHTNAALRAGGGGQARHSLHMQGRAIDIRLADVSSSVLRDVALELRRGGVGYYRSEDFVHVDTGPVRRW